MLIPVTNSLLLPAKLVSASRVTTDIGTGFYVEQPLASGQEHFQRKAQVVVDNLKRVETALVSKQNAFKCTLSSASCAILSIRCSPERGNQGKVCRSPQQLRALTMHGYK